MTNEVKNVPELRFPGFEGEWGSSELGNIAENYIGGGTPSTKVKEYWNGNIPWIQSSDLKIDDVKHMEFHKYINSLAIENSSAKLIPKNSIAIVTRVGVGKLALIREEFSTSQDFLSLSNLSLDTNYALYALYKLIRKESTKLQGTSIKGLTKNDLLSKHIKIPSYINEQEQIGDFFSKLDRQIELEEQKLAKLEKQKKGYMQKLFSQKLRFKDENGNDYPEWEEKTIKDVYKVTRGYVLARKLMSDNPNSINKYPVYSSQTSNNGLMGYYSDYLYQDAITWTTDGANAGSVSFRQGKFYCTNVCGVLLNELGNSNVCMAEMLNNIAFKYVSKVGNPKLMNNVMAMIKLKFPCLEEQQVISNFLNVFSEVIDNQNKKVELLKKRKEGLLQKMFV